MALSEQDDRIVAQGRADPGVGAQVPGVGEVAAGIMIDIKSRILGNGADLPVSLFQVGVDHDDVHVCCVIDERILPQERTGEVGADDRAVFPGPLRDIAVTQPEKLFLCDFHNFIILR